MISARLRLNLLLAAVCVPLGVGYFLLLQILTTTWLVDDLRNELDHLGALSVSLLHEKGYLTDAAAQDLVDRIATPSETRAVIVDPAGSVLADSFGTSVPHPALREMTEGLAPPLTEAQLNKRGATDRFRGEVSHTATLPVRNAAGEPLLLVLTSFRSSYLNTRDNFAILNLIGIILSLTTIILVANMALSTYMSGAQKIRDFLVTLRVENFRNREPGTEFEIPEEIYGILGTSLRGVALELERSLNELRLQEAYVRTVFGAFRDGVLAIDKRQRIQLANDAFRNLFELHDDPTGKLLIEVIRLPVVHHMVQEAMNGAPATCEFDSPGPRRKIIYGHAAPLSTNQGVVTVFYDITQLRVLQQSQRDFIANASHELRTPVGIITNATENLLSGAIDHPKHGPKFLNTVIRNTERLSHLVDDLLDLSRIEARETEMSMEVIFPAQLIDDVVSSFEAKASERGFTIEKQLDRTVAVHADSKALMRILTNLVENALKYTPDGGTIRLEAFLDGAEVEIRCIDNGPGIDPRHRQRIFERFYRVDSVRSTTGKGTGLGLSIARKLARHMGGDMAMRPAQPSGSEFWVRLTAADSTPPTYESSEQDEHLRGSDERVH